MRDAVGRGVQYRVFQRGAAVLLGQVRTAARVASPVICSGAAYSTVRPRPPMRVASDEVASS